MLFFPVFSPFGAFTVVWSAVPFWGDFSKLLQSEEITTPLVFRGFENRFCIIIIVIPIVFIFVFQLFSKALRKQIELE